MSLEQIASLAEIIGLLLVFATLIYVARQLNQTTAMMRVSASGERLQRDTDIVNSIVHSREIAEFWMQGDTEFDHLDEINKQRLVFLSVAQSCTDTICAVFASKTWCRIQTGSR